MICEIDGRVLGSMQFGVVVQVLEVLVVVLFEVLVTVWRSFARLRAGC